MAATYEPIATTTLGSAVSTVTFSSIAGTYTDLELVFAGTDSAFGSLNIQLNGDTATNYSYTIITGDGTTAASSRGTSVAQMNLGVTGTAQSVSKFMFMNYSNTTTYKTVLSRGNSAANQVRAGVGMRRNTAAITSITVQGTSLQVGSVLTLYGIKAA
jgi:hypothetical protein